VLDARPRGFHLVTRDVLAALYVETDAAECANGDIPQLIGLADVVDRDRGHVRHP